MLGEGVAVELLFLLFAAVVTFYHLYTSIQGKEYPLRRMAQVEAISDCIDRSVETGLPVFVSAGDLAYLSGFYAQMTISGMNVIRHTATMAVERNAKIIFPVPYIAEALPLIDGIYREVCVAAGKPEAYDPDNVRYYGNTNSIHGQGFMHDLAREGVAAAIIIGATGGGGSTVPGGFARDLGGIVIAGTPRYLHNGTWAMLAHYPLFNDDIYAAGAICSHDNVTMASLAGGDLIKLVLIAIALIGVIAGVAGLPVNEWLKL